MQAEITEVIARKVLDTVDAGLVKGVGKPVAGSMCVEAAVCYALGLPHGDDPACVSRALRNLKIKLNDANWSSKEARAKGLRRLALIQLGSAGALDDRAFAMRVAELAIRKSVPEALRAAASVQKDTHHASALRDAADLCEKEGTEDAVRKGGAYAAAYAAYAANAAAAYAANAAAAYAAYAAYAANAAAAYAANAAAAYAAYAAYAANAAAAYAANAAAAYAAYAADSAAYAAADSAAAYSADSARDKSLADFCEAVVQILIDMNVPGVQWLALTEAV